MASPLAGARILRERIGNRGVSSEKRSRAEEEEELSAALSLLLSWTSDVRSDEGSETVEPLDD
jgi:hypothetical protein